jgi:glycine cleavage system regulatory protein
LATKHGPSIDKIKTDQEIAPYGAAMLFKMRRLPPRRHLASRFDISRIKRELEALGDSLNCDVSSKMSSMTGSEQASMHLEEKTCS